EHLQADGALPGHHVRVVVRVDERAARLLEQEVEVLERRRDVGRRVVDGGAVTARCGDLHRRRRLPHDDQRVDALDRRGVVERQERLARGGHDSLYSGPEPPSGGVSRPPFAVMAPHWTQFDAVTCTAPSVHSYTCAGHIRSHMRPSSSGTRAWTRIWLGWSSRVLFPDAKTDDSLSNVSFPS